MLAGRRSVVQAFGDAAADYAVANGVKLPFWRVTATSGLGLQADVPPIFRADDFTWLPPFPTGAYVNERADGMCDLFEPGAPTESGTLATYQGAYPCAQARSRLTTGGGWTINLYGVPLANVVYFTDPNLLYVLGGGPGSPPSSFTFGIKSGRDQGRLWRYALSQSEQLWLPVSTTGLIGGRGSLFDTNEFIRSGNRQALITVVALVGGAYFAVGAEAAAASSAAADAAAAAEAASAADIAGGLVPAYGSTAAYDAAIAASAGAGGAAEIAGGAAEYIGTGSSVAAGGGDIAAQTAYAAGTEAASAGTATSSAWSSFLKQATDAAGKVVVSQLAKQVMPGKTPAQSAGVSGEYRLADGTIARVNPDGSITIIDPSKPGAQVLGAGGQVTQQWFAGVPNVAVVLGGLALLSLALLR